MKLLRLVGAQDKGRDGTKVYSQALHWCSSLKVVLEDFHPNHLFLPPKCHTHQIIHQRQTFCTLILKVYHLTNQSTSATLSLISCIKFRASIIHLSRNRTLSLIQNLIRLLIWRGGEPALHSPYSIWALSILKETYRKQRIALASVSKWYQTWCRSRPLVITAKSQSASSKRSCVNVTLTRLSSSTQKRHEKVISQIRIWNQ